MIHEIYSLKFFENIW